LELIMSLILEKIPIIHLVLPANTIPAIV
jgi:hypothetical protein